MFADMHQIQSKNGPQKGLRFPFLFACSTLDEEEKDDDRVITLCIGR